MYPELDPNTEEGRRTARRLLSLKSLLSQTKKNPGKGAPAKSLDQSLLLATWNIRELGRNEKFGPRLPETFHYLAEVMRAFDLIAVQEIHENLADFKRVMELLGRDWKYLLTDITLGHQGNWERMAFVYDARKVRFDGLAGQVVLPPVKVGNKTYQPAKQLARTPLMVGFSCGWFKFTLCTVHILYGEQQANDARRVAEIRALGKVLRERADSPHAWAPNMVLLGDFNIFEPTDQTAKALTDAGFHLPKQIQKLSSTETRKHYDQIALYSKKYGAQQTARTNKARAGVVQFYDTVFTEKDLAEGTYTAALGQRLVQAKDKLKVFREWRSFQMSDHRLLWIELPVDFSRGYLANVMNGKGKALAPETLTAQAGDP